MGGRDGDVGMNDAAGDADVEELCAVLLAAWERLASAPLSASSSGIVRSATVSASGGEHIALALDEYRALLIALKMVPLVSARAASCLLDSAKMFCFVFFLMFNLHMRRCLQFYVCIYTS